MEPTIRYIKNKVQIIELLIGELKTGDPDKDSVEKNINCLDELKSTFAMSVAPVFADESGDIKSLLMAIQSSKIADCLDSLFENIAFSIGDKILPPSCRKECEKVVRNYKFGFNIFSFIKIDYEICTGCGSPMSVDSESSELQCLNCSRIKELVGLVFDDSQFYGQEGQKTKTGTFNPNRHFHFWWVHILARESEEELGDKNDPNNLYGEKLLDSLRYELLRRRKIAKLLRVDDIRLLLKSDEVKRTDLNKNASLILKKLTGIGPPQPDESFSKQVESKFSMAIEIGESLQRIGRSNRNYYPYYIYKIVESLTTPSHEMYGILKFIYLQSEETVTNDDLDWEKICPHIGIKYKATNRCLTR